MIHFLIFGGCVSSFSVFFKTIQQTFDSTAADVAWLPAILSFVMFMIGNPSNWSRTFNPINNNNNNNHYCYYRNHYHHCNCDNCGRVHEESFARISYL